VGFRVDVRRGEGRGGQRAVPVVVEADDRQVAGRGEAEVAHGRQDAQRHVVVEGRHGGHRGRAARISARESAAPVLNTGIENGATGDSPSISAVSAAWGEHPGAGTSPDADLGFPRIRATVAPAPYDAHARTQYRRS
jgi:syringate O-demethylase